MRRIPWLLLALLGILTTCRNGETTSPPTASVLAPVSGNNQNGTVGQALSQPLVVVVRDQRNSPMSGVAVTWAVSTGGGQVSSAAAATDAQGHSSVTWTLGTNPGSQTATATLNGVAGSPVSFTASAQPGAAAILVFTVQPSNAAVGAVIAPPVEVSAQDAFGNPITTFTGSVTLSLGSNPGSGTLSGTLTHVAAQGVATFSDLSIDQGGTGYTLHAAAGGPQGTSAAFNVTGPPPVTLAFTPQPASHAAGAGGTITVTAQDPLGATVTSFTGTVTLTLVSDPGGAPTGGLTGTTTVAAVAGVATFSAVATNVVGCYRLVATATGLQIGTSNAFCVTAGAAAHIAASGGDNQTALAGATLPTAYAVTVTDDFGNAVAGVTVDWAPVLGGGSMNPTQNTTGSNGVASSARTLGASPGTQTATATSTGPSGSPVTFTATATSPPSISSITPDTLVEGQSATLTGTGFSATPANNTVQVGGLAATVNAASSTSLTITVPTTSCQPARDVPVSVTVGTATSNTVTQRLHPAGLLNLAVGQQVIVQDPSQFCLQFRPSAAGGDAYLVGVGAAAESPGSTLPFTLSTLTGAPGASAPFPVQALASQTVSGAVPLSTTDVAGIQRQQAQLAGEQVIRTWERQHLVPAQFHPPPRVSGAQAVQAVPSVGDTLHFRVPDFSAPNPCATFTTITTVVRAVGAAGIWVTDTANPPLDSLTTAEIQGYSDTFDLKIFKVDTLYFGAPSDLDQNQRIVIVLTIQVNEDPLGIAGFVFGGDLFDRSVCNQSNGGELFYGNVPDAGNAAGTGARPKATVVEQLPALIAHEFTHDIQISRRLLLGASTFMSAWEMEGQAVLADEVVGHSVLGNTTGQNYGATVAFTAEQGNRWYAFGAAGAFQELPEYFGWLPPGTSTKAANAPELCTLFGTTSLSTPCYPFAFYGASWSLQRYLADRFGASYPGGETALNHDLIGKNVTLAGSANVSAVLGVQFDSLLAQWGAMLYVDDRVGGLPAPLQLPSWNLFDVFGAFVSDAFRLVPVNRTFTAFTDSRSVRSGSNAYTLISAASARPALALRVRDPADAVLGTALRPEIWIVRVQ